MPIEHLVAILGTAFLFTGGLLLALAVWRGRGLCRRLAAKFPQEYEVLDSPWPGFWNSARRSAYYRFLLQRKFEQLPDRQLVMAFEEARRREMRDLTFLLVGFGLVGVAWVYIEVLGGGT